MGRRPWHCYARWHSKWAYQIKRSHKQDLVRGRPDRKVRMFDVGNKTAPLESWDIIIGLMALERVLVSSNCLEAVRQALNRKLQKLLSRERYHFRIRVKPLHIYRENKMMAFAGADRLQTGMRQSFGRPAGLAARVDGGQILVEVRVNERDFAVAKQALKVVAKKFCCTTKIVLLSSRDGMMQKRVGLPIYTSV